MSPAMTIFCMIAAWMDVTIVILWGLHQEGIVPTFCGIPLGQLKLVNYRSNSLPSFSTDSSQR